MQNSKFIPHRT